MSHLIITSIDESNWNTPVHFEGFSSNVGALLRAGWTIERRYNPYSERTMVYFKSYIRKNISTHKKDSIETKIPMLGRGLYNQYGISLDFLIQQHNSVLRRSISDYDTLVFKNMSNKFTEDDVGDLLNIIKELQAPKQQKIIKEMEIPKADVIEFIRKIA